MLIRLKMERFRGFASLDTEIRPLTAVIGRNSSGKTTLLHAIRIALEALDIGLAESSPVLGADGSISVCKDLIVQDSARLHSSRDWADLFTNRQVGELAHPLQLELQFHAPEGIQEIRLKLASARNHQLKMSLAVVSQAVLEKVKGIPARSRARGETLHDELKARMPRAIFVPAFYGVTREEEYRTRAIVGRLLGGGDQSHIVRNLVAQLSASRFARLNDFLKRSLGASLTRRTTAQDAETVLRLEVLFRDTNGELELSSAGAGLINLIALYSAMSIEQYDAKSTQRPMLFLLDEPEAHLHPRLQGDIGEALGELSTEFGAQLLVATHSVEMINRLGQRTDTLLLSVDRATSTVTRLDSNSAIINELAQWCDLTPFTSLNFLASRNILFHEGPTDEIILTACAELYFRNDPVKRMRFREWTFSSLAGTGNIKAVGILRAVLNPSIFPSLSKGQKVRAIVVLDRDAERTPGLSKVEEASKDRFEAYKKVWSHYSIESLFLQTSTLAAWISLVLPDGTVSMDQLQQHVKEGLERADEEQTLQDKAEELLLLANLRNGLKPPDALKQAKQRARADPAVWQKGKDRADFVLKHVREQMPKPLQNRVRGSIPSLVEAATAQKLGDVPVLIPEDIRALLDVMVA